MSTNVIKHARELLKTDPNVRNAWIKFLDQTGKESKLPVPGVWYEFIEWTIERELAFHGLLPGIPDSSPTPNEVERDTEESESQEYLNVQGESFEFKDNSKKDVPFEEIDLDYELSGDRQEMDSDQEETDSDQGETDSDRQETDNDQEEIEEENPHDDTSAETAYQELCQNETSMESQVRQIAEVVTRYYLQKHRTGEHKGGVVQSVQDVIDTLDLKPLPKPVETPGYKLYWFDEALELLRCGVNVLLIGPTGCGKTYTCAMLAQALSLDFYPISFAGGIDESYLMGWILPSEGGKFEYRPSSFVTGFEQGGLVLADEFDAGDSNVLLIWNMAIANGVFPIPQRYDNALAKKHETTRFIAAANTTGHGATRRYVGRNQLDDATLDRYRDGQLVIDYDPKMEKALYHPECVKFAHRLRERCREQKGWERDVSTRNIATNHQKMLYGMPLERAWYPYFMDWNQDELRAINVNINKRHKTVELI